MRRVTVVVVALCALLSHLCVGSERGDEQLARAFDAALISMYADNTINEILRANDVMGFMQVMDCMPNTTLYQYPEPAEGVLLEILNRGYVVIGARENFASAGYANYSNPPSGANPDIEREAFRRVGEHYGKSLYVQYNLNFSSTDAVMVALTNFEIDATASNYGYGSFTGGQRRSLLYRGSCSTVGEQIYMATNASSGISSHQDLLNTIATVNLKSQAKLGAVGTSSFQAIQEIFLDAVVVQYTTDTVALSDLATDPSLLAVAAFKHASAVDPFIWFKLEFIIPRVMFFRLETYDENKVENSSTLQSWETGNKALMQAYDAALTWLNALEREEAIFLRYNLTIFGFGDCIVKEGAYPTPESVGTLFNIIDSHKLRIGAPNSASPPFFDGTGLVPVGAIPDLERAVTTWLSRAFSTFDPILVDYHYFNSTVAIFDALESGTIDATTSFMFAGGSIKDTPRRRKFQASCVTTVNFLFIYSMEYRNITSEDELSQYLNDHPGLYIGGLQTGNAQIMSVLYGTLVEGVIVYYDIQTAFLALQNDSLAAFLGDADQSTLPVGVSTFSTHFVSPACSFFRKDKVAACGDTVVDENLGEVCEGDTLGCQHCVCEPLYKPTVPVSSTCALACGDTILDPAWEECDSGVGCSGECKCKSDYSPMDPLTVDCDEDSFKSMAAILGGVIGGFVFIIVMAVIILLAFFPYFKAKYIKEGQLRQRFAIFKSRSSSASAT